MSIDIAAEFRDLVEQGKAALFRFTPSADTTFHRTQAEANREKLAPVIAFLNLFDNSAYFQPTSKLTKDGPHDSPIHASLHFYTFGKRWEGVPSSEQMIIWPHAQGFEFRFFGGSHESGRSRPEIRGTAKEIIDEIKSWALSVSPSGCALLDTPRPPEPAVQEERQTWIRRLGL